MAMPTFTMRQLLEAGVHFGHTTRRWNPKMKPFIFGERNGIHIIDLEQTVPMLNRSLEAVRDIAAAGGRVLFVGTKRQAQPIVRENATKCGQYFINHRWLGGMLTNWRTISHSIKRLKELEELLAKEETGLTKKETLVLERERDKLETALGGIKEMGNTPDILFIIDTNKESIAVKEANKLGIPVCAVIDSNSDPDGIDYPIPGNDDAMRAVNMYCDLVAGAVLEGLQQSMGAAGVDVGADIDAGAGSGARRGRRVGRDRGRRRDRRGCAGRSRDACRGREGRGRRGGRARRKGARRQGGRGQEGGSQEGRGGEDRGEEGRGQEGGSQEDRGEEGGSQEDRGQEGGSQEGRRRAGGLLRRRPAVRGREGATAVAAASSSPAIAFAWN